MALRRASTRLFQRRHFIVSPARLEAFLSSCGLRDIAQSRDLASDSATCQLFAPLFTPHFTIESHRLTTLGDTLIDAYLSRAVLNYAVHTGLILTVNATRQLNAVLHNHFALRLFAKELRFDELAFPLHLDATTETSSAGHGALDFLEAQHVGLRAHDAAGTSFAMTPLRAGQSPLGWVFSHFVGALHMGFGPLAVQKLLAHTYDGIDAAVNIPSAAVKLLLRTLEHFPAANVAEAILAAQGLPVRFTTKTRMLPDDCKDKNSPSESKGESTETAETEKNAGRRVVDADAVVCSGFGELNEARDAATIDGLAADLNVFASLAAGPGGMDAIATWRKRDAARTASHERQTLADPSGVAVPDDKQNMSRRSDEDDGWIAPLRGAAFAHAVDFSSAATYFADMYGTPQPINGQRITRQTFRDPPRDPLFYDRRSDMREGVPIDTDGETTTAHVDRFLSPHARLFEVSLIVGSGNGRTAGRAVAQRYTIAREAACRAFVGAVLHDLHRMKERAAQGNGK